MQYQKVSSSDTTVTFNVWASTGEQEQVTYKCINGETEDQLMARVAAHFETTIQASKNPPVEEEVFPVIEVGQAK
jgi:hypothetical protein